MRYVRLTAMIVSVSLRRALAFRANLAAESLVSVVSVTTSLAILQSIYQVAGSLGGWSRAEATLLLGLYLVASGLMWACIEPNLGWFRNQITQGQLDDVLLRPVSSMYLASLGSCSPLALTQAVLGLVLLAAGVVERGVVPSLPDVILAGAMFAAGCVSIWAIRLLLASLAFWAPGVQPDVGFKAVWEFGRYPVTVYQRPVRLILTYAIPLAVVATIPTRALTGELGWEAACGAIVSGAIVVIAARWVWRAGLRQYTSATS